jgi:chromosome segregation ATPase
MSEKNTAMEELKRMKNDQQNVVHSGSGTQRSDSSLPAWLWLGLGIILGIVSVIIFSAQYLSEKDLSRRGQEIDRKEALLGDFEHQKRQLMEKISELSSKQVPLQEAVDRLQAELKAGSSVIAEYRVVKDEHEILTSELSDLREARRQAEAELDIIDRDLTNQRSEYAVLLSNYTNKTARISSIQNSIMDTDKALEVAGEQLEQKKLALSSAEQKLQLSQTKLGIVKNQSNEADSKLQLLESNIVNEQRTLDELKSDVVLLEARKVQLGDISSELLTLGVEKKELQQKLDDLKKETVVYETIKQQLAVAKRDLTGVTEQLTTAARRLDSQDQKLAQARGEINDADDRKSALLRDSNTLKAEVLKYEAIKKRLTLAKDDLSDTNILLAGRQKELSLTEDQLSKVKRELAVVKAELSAAEKQLNKSAK